MRPLVGTPQAVLATVGILEEEGSIGTTHLWVSERKEGHWVPRLQPEEVHLGELTVILLPCLLYTSDAADE